MALNKQSGNMYQFVTHTFNIIKGKCSHNCDYCYMKRFPQKELHFDKKELKTDLGEGNFIFVGSSCDMFEKNVPNSWIADVLEHCLKYPKNKYLFQSKNPQRFIHFKHAFENMNCVLATTIETNRLGFNYNAPAVTERQFWIGQEIDFATEKMVTVEPVIDFDVDILVNWLKDISGTCPAGSRLIVHIGADSNTNKNYSFPEPSREKIMELIDKLEKFTDVKIKTNLSRIK